MGKSANVVTFTGNLGKTPEVTFTTGGMAVCKFPLAVSDRKKGKDGAWAEVTMWLRVTCFGKTAEACGQYLDKGRPALVSGKLEVDVWTDKDGKERTSVGVVASEVVFLGSGQGGERQKPPEGNPPPSGGIGDGAIDDDSLPF